MRERGGHTGEHEAAHTEDDEDHHRKGETVVAGGDKSSDAENEGSTQQVGVDEHLAASPFVEEHAGEGADEGIGEEEDDEGGRDRGGRGLSLGGEQDERRKRCLQETIGTLAGEADPKETPEVADGDDRTQVGQGRHGVTLSAGASTIPPAKESVPTPR